MGKFIDNLQETLQKKAEETNANATKVDETITATFGNTILGTMPKALRNKCLLLSCLFGGIGILGIVFAIVYKTPAFIICAVALILFAILSTFNIIFQYRSGNILEITGVIISRDKGGYRRQKKYASVEDDKHRVFRIMLTDGQRRYKVGDIITFYTTKDGISSPVDAEYRVFKLFAVERFNASIMEEEAEEQDNFDDLTLKPKDE